MLNNSFGKPRRIASLALLVCGGAAMAAEAIDTHQVELIQSHIAQTGYAPVILNLSRDKTLPRSDFDRTTRIADYQNRSTSVIAELGAGALAEGRWVSNLGQIGVYVDASGLRTVQNTQAITNFAFDDTRSLRVRVDDSDGSLTIIEDVIKKEGRASVRLTLNIDSFSYELDAKGSAKYSPESSMSTEARKIIDELSKRRSSSKYELFPLWVDPATPVFAATINLEAFLELKESPHVRAITPLQLREPDPPKISQRLTEAPGNGNSEVLVTLNGGEPYTAKIGYVSAKYQKTQSDAHRRALLEIFQNTEVTQQIERLSAIALFVGEVPLVLSQSDIQAVARSADRRLRAIDANDAMATSGLSVSAEIMNAPQAWTAGYTAAGQIIAIIDDGVWKNNLMFSGPSGARVMDGACFATQGVEAGIAYASYCINKNSLGDSPPGTASAGGPARGSVGCPAGSTSSYANCNHGTHVASIAAGSKHASIMSGTLQGIGPAATLYPVNIKSFAVSGNVFMKVDTVAAWEHLLGQTVPGINPATINMSFSGNTHSALHCPENGAGYVASLISRGVPVVVSTGNAPIGVTLGSRTELSWPACMKNTVKVASVENNVPGTNFSAYANIARPDGPFPYDFVGPIFLAPGNVRAAGIMNQYDTNNKTGTSMAAPHIAGVYALVKAADPASPVDAITAWIRLNATYSVTATGVGDPPASVIFRGVRLPNL